MSDRYMPCGSGFARGSRYRWLVCCVLASVVLLGANAVRFASVAQVSAAPLPPGAIAPQPPRHGAPAATVMPTTTASARAPAPHGGSVNPQPPVHSGIMQPGSVSAQASSHPIGVQMSGAGVQPPRHDSTDAHFARGVNLPAPAFNSPEVLPGVLGTNYDYPTPAELDYFKSKGLTLFRLPFAWERMQPILNGPLDATQLGYMDALVAAAHARSLQVILDQHNFDRYCVDRMHPCTSNTSPIVGTATVPNSAFADFWRKFAIHYASETAIAGYDLTNEPHDTGSLWPATAQAGTDAIRQVDQTHTIVIEGENYSGGSTWAMYNENLTINDPTNNILYSAHVYFDADASGQYVNSYDVDGAYPTIGVDRAQPFVDWLNRHHVRGYVGEYGVPDNDARWLTVLDTFLTYLDTNALSGTYWAGGPFLDGYPLSVEPTGGMDRPQMAILVQHPGK